MFFMGYFSLELSLLETLHVVSVYLTLFLLHCFFYSFHFSGSHHFLTGTCGFLCYTVTNSCSTLEASIQGLLTEC